MIPETASVFDGVGLLQRKSGHYSAAFEVNFLQ
jgi:hypothetical protein